LNFPRYVRLMLLSFIPVYFQHDIMSCMYFPSLVLVDSFGHYLQKMLTFPFSFSVIYISRFNNTAAAATTTNN
jgi:hypothetical protein